MLDCDSTSVCDCDCVCGSDRCDAVEEEISLVAAAVVENDSEEDIADVAVFTFTAAYALLSAVPLPPVLLVLLALPPVVLETAVAAAVLVWRSKE